MAIGIKAPHLAIVPHALAVSGAVMVLVWCIYFLGGLAWESSNKSLIFNSDIIDVLLSTIGILEKFTLLNIIRKQEVKHFTQSLLLAANVLKSTTHLLSLQIHPVLMLIGFIIIGGEAIMSYKSLPLRKEVKKVIHLVLHAIALILGIIGIYTAFKYHNESSIANLYSLHSWIGIGVIVLYGIQWIYGFLVFFYPGGSTELRRESLPWHVLFGLLVYILAIGNASIGFLEKLTFLENSGLEKYGAEAYLVNFTALVTILYGAFVIFTVFSEAPTEDDHGYSAI